MALPRAPEFAFRADPATIPPMNLRVHAWTAVAVALLAGRVDAADSRLLFSVIAPTTAVRAGEQVDVQVAVLNRSTGSAPVALPAQFSASLIGPAGRRPVVVTRSDGRGGAEEPVPVRGFVLQTYRLQIPDGMSPGAVTLEASWPEAGTVRTALEITAADARLASSSPAVTQRPTTTLARAEPAAAALRQTFADRIRAHEPLYFIYGPDEPGAKFQFSFKYKLLEFSGAAPQRMVRTLQFAFTQRSVWDIDGVSSPFYDTSYMPEVIYESLAPESSNTRGWFQWLGFQVAYKHESNGRDGPLSRTVNIAYARPVFAFGALDRWHLLVMPEVFSYLSRPDDNPDIEDYRGFGKLHLVFGRNDGPTLMATLWSGKEFDRFSTQLDFTLPIRTRLLNFATYLLVQYWNGYGESLLSYRERSDTIRAGFSLVR